MEKEQFKVDFICIGAQKAGTSWIHQCLKEHPEVCTPKEKENHFFNFNYHKGISYYQSLFSHCKNKKIIGETTPYYIFDKKSAERIHSHFPEVKIIACLRDPVDRALSAYNWFFRKKREKFKNFEEIIQTNNKVLARGLYYKQLKRYFDLFPRENILVLIYEDSKNNPLTFIQEIYKFLNIKDSFIPQSLNTKVHLTKRIYPKSKFLNKLFFYLKKTIKKILPQRAIKSKIIKKVAKIENINTTDKKKPTSKHNLKPETINYLRSYYQEDIERLEKLINRDLDFWKN